MTTSSLRLCRRALVRLAHVLLSLVALNSAKASTFTWTGSTSVTTTWSDTTHWVGGAAPASGVTTTSDQILKWTTSQNTTDANDLGSVSVNSITVNNSSTGGKAVTISGTSANNLVFVIASDNVTLPTLNLTENAGAGSTNITIPFTVNNFLTINNNGVLTPNVSGAITNNAGIKVTGSSISMGGLVSGAGGLTVAMSTSATLSTGTVSTFTGVTTVTSGTLSAGKLANGGSASSIGQSTNVAANLVLDGGTLKYTGAVVSTDRLFTLTQNGGTLNGSGTGAVTFAGNTSSGPNAIAFSGSGARTLTLTGTTASNSFAPILGDGTGGATALDKEGTGSWAVTGANTYTGGTTVNSGTLTMGTSGTLGATTGTLVVSNTNSSAAGTDVVLTLATTANTTTGSLSGTIATPTSGTNTATINTGSGEIFTVNQTANGTYAGVIAGSGSFKLGSSSTKALTLTGSNTYSAGTTINGGTLYANNGSGTGTGTGNVTVASTGTLAGNGMIAPTGGSGVTVQNGGTLSSGGVQTSDATHDTITGTGLNLTENSSSLLTVNGGATLTFALGSGGGLGTVSSPNMNSTYLNISNTNTGVTADKIFSNTTTAINIKLVDLTAFSSTDTLQFNLGNTFLLINSGLTTNDDFSNLMTTGGLGQDGFVTGVFNGTTGYTAFNVTAMNINNVAESVPNLQLYLYNGELEVVPEPGTWALMLGGLGVLVFWQRRKNV